MVKSDSKTSEQFHFKIFSSDYDLMQESSLHCQSPPPHVRSLFKYQKQQNIHNWKKKAERKKSLYAL